MISIQQKEKKKVYATHFASEFTQIEVDKYEQIFEKVATHNPKKFLDIGCGDGSFATMVKERLHSDVYGIDVSEKAISLAENKNIQASIVDMDSEDLPYEDNFFDCIFCGDVIEHLYSPDHLLEEVRRVLKSNGILILATPNMAAWYNRLSLLLGFQLSTADTSLYYNFDQLFPMKANGHLRLYTKKALHQLLIAYKFKFVSAEGIGVSKHVGMGAKYPIIVSIINFIFKSASFNSGILMVARKNK